jgi:predicted small metal-binding protein
MERVIECACGYVIRAEDEEGLVSQAQKHATDVHGMELTREQALEMSRPS